MKPEKIHELLIGYAEGTLSPEEKSQCDQLLESSDKLRYELKLLQDTLTIIQSEPEANVPEHYFTNFLPHLRNKIQNKKNVRFWFIPSWVESFVAPVITVTFIVGFFLLYQVMLPEQADSPMYEVVKELEQNDLNNVVEQSVSFDDMNGIIYYAETLIKKIVNSDNVANQIQHELLAFDAVIQQSETDWIDILDEHEVDLMISHLEKNSIP